jgi:MFS family permease
MSVWLSAAVPDSARGRALGGLSTAMFLGQFLSPIISQPLTKSLGLGGVYAFTGAILTILGLVFAVLKSQIRQLAYSR